MLRWGVFLVFLLCTLPVFAGEGAYLASVDHVLSDAEVQQLVPPSSESKSMSLRHFIVLAFLAGLMLSALPSVFPLLCLAWLGAMQAGNWTNSQTRRRFLSALGGVFFAIFSIAGSMFIISLLGYDVSTGWLLQQPFWLISLILLLIIGACYIWDVFTISIPETLAQKVDVIALGYALLGMVTVILSTAFSITFVENIVQFTISEGIVKLIIMAVMIGLGLAWPLWLVGCFPGLIYICSSSPPWMEKFKFLLGLAMILSLVWLIWLVAQQLGMRAGVMLFLLCLLVKFVLEADLAVFKKTGVRWLVLVGMIIAAYLIPITSHQQDLDRQVEVKNVWMPLQEERIPSLVDEGYVVVVDVTAGWCIYCHWNKFIVLDRTDVLYYLDQPLLVAMRADITRPTPRVMRYLEKYGRYGVPFTIVYGPANPEGIILKPILFSASELTDAIKKARGPHSVK